ncbi:dihydropteroate synthase [Candidatus Halobeggiatoa sp. HSG11]|nr:dihydropteroate synthase [Candidatus Halobeggiatoa sp. HSG11]
MDIFSQDSSPKIMGILNVTPDSFSDGGKFFSSQFAIKQARLMIEEGADIIDIGGESTRPGAKPVSVQEELDRVIPVVEQIRAEFPTSISVDTSKSVVMQEAIKVGADIINDIMALRGENSLATVANSEVKVCLMHIQGEPRTMQNEPHYDDVVSEVKDFLLTRIQACLDAGIKTDRIIIDPGFGFGKTLEHNLTLMRKLTNLTELNYPVLIGVSRKSMIGALLNKPVTERLHGGIALAVLAVNRGAKIIRTHDVATTIDAIKIAQAVI